MIIFEVGIYLIFALIMYYFARQSYITTVGTPKETQIDGYFWLFWLFFALLCAIRWNVGADCQGYARNFKTGIINEEKGEWLWAALVLFIHKFGLHYTFGLGICGFVQIYFMTKLASKYKYMLIFLPFVLFGSELFFISFNNGVRQMMAACIFVFSTQFILKKKIIPYLICIAIAYQIHHTVLLVLPMYLLAYIRPDKLSFSDKRFLCVGVFVFCVIFGRSPQLQGIAHYMTIITEWFGDNYNYVGDEINRTIVESDNDSMDFGPTMLSNFLASFFPIFFGKELKTAFKNKMPYFDIWWLLMFIYSCGFFLFINLNYIFVRPFNHFIPFLALMLSLLFYYFYSNNKKILFAVLFLSLWVGMVWNIMKVASLPFESTTYKVFWMH